MVIPEARSLDIHVRQFLPRFPPFKIFQSILQLVWVLVALTTDLVIESPKFRVLSLTLKRTFLELFFDDPLFFLLPLD